MVLPLVRNISVVWTKTGLSSGQEFDSRSEHFFFSKKTLFFFVCQHLPFVFAHSRCPFLPPWSKSSGQEQRCAENISKCGCTKSSSSQNYNAIQKTWKTLFVCAYERKNDTLFSLLPIFPEDEFRSKFSQGRGWNLIIPEFFLVSLADYPVRAWCKKIGHANEQQAP